MNLEVAKLLVVARVGRLGSVSAAAESLHLTASAVSQHIRSVERGLGVVLFDRRPHGMVFTTAGSLVARRVSEIESQLAGLRGEIEDLADGRIGRVSLGVFPTFASSLLPQLMMDFNNRHPGVNLEIRSTRLRELREATTARNLDVTLTWTYPWASEVSSAEKVGEDPTVLLLPAHHPLGDRSIVEIEELQDERWVCRADGHQVTDLLHRVSAQAGFSPKIVVAANDYQEAQAMVAAGVGIALVPWLALHSERNDLVVKKLPASVPARTIYLTRRGGAGDSKVIQDLVDAIRRALAAHHQRCP